MPTNGCRRWTGKRSSRGVLFGKLGAPLLYSKPITAPRGRAPWWRYSIFPAFLAVNHGPHGDGPRGGPREACGRVPDGLTECLRRLGVKPCHRNRLLEFSPALVAFAFCLQETVECILGSSFDQGLVSIRIHSPSGTSNTSRGGSPGTICKGSMTPKNASIRIGARPSSGAMWAMSPCSLFSRMIVLKPIGSRQRNIGSACACIASDSVFACPAARGQNRCIAFSGNGLRRRGNRLIEPLLLCLDFASLRFAIEARLKMARRWDAKTGSHF